MNFPILSLLLALQATKPIQGNEYSNVSTPSHVFENHGTLLKPNGFVSFSSNKMISLFRKVPLPFMKPFVNCNNAVQTHFTEDIHKITNNYITLFNAIAKPDNTTVNHRRQKRNILAFGIGLGIVDLVLGGISYGSLNHHINAVESKFNDFVSSQHKFDEAFIEFDEKLVKLIEATNLKISEKFGQLQCQILETSGELLSMNFINKWNKVLHDLFKPVTEGKLKIPLTPSMLPPENLQQILSEHPMLKGTYFAKNVYTFYKVTDLAIVQAHYDSVKGFIVIHQVLEFPSLKSENMFPMFRTHQVGIIDHNICLIFQMSKFLYVKDNKYHPIDEANCRLGGQITHCFAETFHNDTSNSCLRNFAKCKIIETTCAPRYIYDTSGILVGTGAQNTDIKIFRKSIEVLRPTNFGTKFISWETVSYIQMGSILVEQPDFVSTNIKYNYSSVSLESWTNKLGNISFNITSLKQSLQHIRALTDKPTTHFSTKTMILIVCIITFVIILLIATIFCIAYKQHIRQLFARFQNNSYQHPATNIETEETPNVVDEPENVHNSTAYAPNVSVIY